jgi:trans-aconitate methyltransferase
VDQAIWHLTGLQDSVEVMGLACGSGQVRRRMAEMYPTIQVLGIAASEDLLAEAALFRRYLRSPICVSARVTCTISWA